MRYLLGGAAILALAAATAAGAPAAPASGGTSMSGYGPMSQTKPKCTSTNGPVVWYVASSKMYYSKGSKMYGKGSGSYICKGTATSRGGKAYGGSSMSGMSGMHSPAPASKTLKNAGHTGRAGGAYGSSSGGNQSGSGTRSGSPMPMGSSSMNNNGNNMGNASGNQGGNMPGAGGQTQNNPASSTNNASPKPRPS